MKEDLISPNISMQSIKGFLIIIGSGKTRREPIHISNGGINNHPINNNIFQPIDILFHLSSRCVI